MDGDEATASGTLDNEVVSLPARHELAAPAPDIDTRPCRAPPHHTFLIPADVARLHRELVDAADS